MAISEEDKARLEKRAEESVRRLEEEIAVRKAVSGDNKSPVVASLVYFIQAESGGPIKIGHTKNLRDRLSSLQNSGPVTLTVLAVTTGGARKERELHFRFRRDRLHGEWFKPGDELMALIERARKEHGRPLL